MKTDREDGPRIDGGALLKAIQRVDQRTLHFRPFGLGGRFESNMSARFLADSAAAARLADDVPKTSA